MADLGEVEIELDGKLHMLRCSLRAARTVSAMSGGFVGAYDGVNRFVMATFVSVIAAGLDKKTGGEMEEVEKLVYETGLEMLAKPVTTYLARLMNGGREPSMEQEKAPGKA